MIGFGDLMRGVLALLMILLTHSSCGSDQTMPESVVTGPICGPCDMGMPLDYPFTEIAGMQFAVCGGLCEELISADPEKYREFAVGE